MPQIDFDPVTHTYKIDGRILPSVTQVLESVGISDFSMVSPDVLRDAQQLGTDVHRLLELYDKGTIDYDTVSDYIAPYLPPWVDFLETTGAKIIEIEKKVYCERYQYVGTLDRILEINGKLSVLDIKTGGNQLSHSIQTAAYLQAYNKDRRKKFDRYTWYVDTEKKKQKWKLVKNDDPNDINIFLSALTVCKFKRNKK